MRTYPPPAAIARSVRDVVRQIDPGATVSNVATMEQLVSNSMTRPRFYAVVLGIFAAVAALLAAVGIYGVVAYAVTQRTREIGVRVALGARRGDLLKLVLGQSVALAAAGMALGLVAAVPLTRYLGTMLFGLTPLDPATYALVAALLAVVAALAAFVPARRATRIDPLVALRYE